MPTPREIALAENNRTAFEVEPKDEDQNPQAKEPDYRANPSNPPDGKPPVK